MKLTKAVQIAVAAIRFQRLKITFDAGMFKIYHSDNVRNRACAELYDRYTEAIELLNGLVNTPVSLGTEPPASNLDLDSIDRDIQRKKHFKEN